ncbi:MAG: carbamoyltransferase C-terminal domain-containing protein [Mariprofundaceae bacterium]|nr:carbamoyltransferase C-terminal domain-containing protein [Mariprofundaceae bacterium]
MSKKILGLHGYSYLETNRVVHNSSIALLDDRGAVLFATEEERLSRDKNDGRFPSCTLQAWADDIPSDIEVAWVGTLKLQQMMDNWLNFYLWLKEVQSLRGMVYFAGKFFEYFVIASKELIFQQRRLPPHLSSRPCHRVLHHEAHAASAYYCSPWSDKTQLVITLDGNGDGHSGSIWRAQTGHMDCLATLPYAHSIGIVYTAWTEFLGFKAHRHEGKIVGLAAYGNGEPLSKKLLSLLTWKHDLPYFNGALSRIAFRKFSAEDMRDMVVGLKDEDIAAGIQVFAEVVVTELVQRWVNKTGIGLLALAGGVFANVKLNQRIMELDVVNNVYIHPNMGDGGLAVGACLATMARQQEGLSPRFLDSVYLGYQITSEGAQAAIVAQGLQGVQPVNLAYEAAQLLAAGKVVARAGGRMEYGPRALGNRTLFASCDDPKINQWLNDKLQRTEFMPFAPIIMAEHAAEYFPAWKPEHIAARFMTVTYDVSAVAKKHIPAAVHIDGTARPQVLRCEDNPEVHALLKAYYKITGVPALINTSFNMHEEPIVCNEEDAVRAYVAGGLDALICADWLVINKQGYTLK